LGVVLGFAALLGALDELHAASAASPIAAAGITSSARRWLRAFNLSLDSIMFLFPPLTDFPVFSGRPCVTRSERRRRVGPPAGDTVATHPYPAARDLELRSAKWGKLPPALRMGALSVAGATQFFPIQRRAA
jgi:hypothetical protein